MLRCKHCDQRKGKREQTMQCPARPAIGHEWEETTRWEDTYIGMLFNWLWSFTIGKIIILIGIVYLIVKMYLEN
jgi:hypothetical protein